jgi:hypothetical protein
MKGMRAPGADTKIADGTWQAGGAAVVRAGAVEVLVTPNGAVTLLKDARPMAVGVAGVRHVWAAIQGHVVDCTTSCRVLDPGVSTPIVAIVPRTETDLILGYADGRVGVYSVPKSGGVPVPASPLAAAIDAVLAKRPRDGAAP